jgi:hypothetical protein
VIVYDGLQAIEVCPLPAVVVLCVCASPVGCHRSAVGELLRVDGYEVVELDAIRQREVLHSSPGQLPLC